MTKERGGKAAGKKLEENRLNINKETGAEKKRVFS